MSSLLTTVNHDIGRLVEGYMINAVFDKQSQEKILDLQSELSLNFEDIIWNAPIDSLHITLMDWLAPLVDYGENKKTIFDNIFNDYDDVFTKTIKDIKPITVNFKEVRVFQKAITVIGKDSGEIESIRGKFLAEIDLIVGTKPPPNIIHSTISRYRKEASLGPIDELVSRHSINLMLTIDHFRLVKEEVVPLLQYEILKKYSLN